MSEAGLSMDLPLSECHLRVTVKNNSFDPEDSLWQEPVRRNGCAWACRSVNDGRGWVDGRGSRKLPFVIKRGHRHEGIHAVLQDRVPGTRFQPWYILHRPVSACLWGPLKKHAHPMYNPIISLIFRSLFWNCPGISCSHVIWGSMIGHREEMNSFHRKRKELIFNKLLRWTLIIWPTRKDEAWKQMSNMMRNCRYSHVLDLVFLLSSSASLNFWVFIVSDLVSRTWWLPGLPDNHTPDLEWRNLTIP